MKGQFDKLSKKDKKTIRAMGKRAIEDYVRALHKYSILCMAKDLKK